MTLCWVLKSSDARWWNTLISWYEPCKRSPRILVCRCMAQTPFLAFLLVPGEGIGDELPIRITHHAKQEDHICRLAKSTIKPRGAHATNPERARDMKSEYPGFKGI